MDAILTKDKFPKEFDEKAIKVFDVLHTVMKETTKAAKGDGIANNQLISAIMSATITELVNLTGCPMEAAFIFAKTAESIVVVHGEAHKDESVH